MAFKFERLGRLLQNTSWKENVPVTMDRRTWHSECNITWEGEEELIRSTYIDL